MKIDKRLNLILQVKSDAGTLHVHSVPISRATFEQHFLVISKVFSAIYQEGLALVGGPRVAALMLRHIAKDEGAWEGREGVEAGLVAEIRRLTNVVVPAERGGWETMPIEDALRAGLISEDDFAEVEGQVTFFTFASVMHKRASLPDVFESLGNLWDSQTSSLNVTEYRDSLPTLTQAANTGETAPEALKLSSVPR